jgi:putative SbcD/Mre11-related phosphoesterase
MDAPEDLSFARRAVYVEPADALVVADLHVGRDARSRVELPLGERTDLRERLDALLARFDPAAVVVAGDFLHSFDRVPREVRESVETVRGTIDDAGADLTVAAGNHDTMLSSLLDPSGAEHRLDDGTVVCHGHERPDADAERYLIGHDHPAIEIEGGKHPCFLYGPGVSDGADVLMLPAFNRLARGAVVNGMIGADFMSPLVGDADAFRPVVYDDDAGDPLAFPPLGALRSHL